MTSPTVELLTTLGLSRRRIIQALTAGAAAGALALGQAGGPGHRARAQAALPADAAADQTLRLGSGSTGAASFLFTPLAGGGDQQNWQTLQWVPPLYFNEALELQPGVFTEWTANDDSTEWTFTLDPAAKFSDNTTITAADVKGTWELMALPATQNGRIVGYLGNAEGFADFRAGNATEITGLTVVDDQTLRVTLSEPDPVFNQRIATTHMNPVKAAQATANPDNFWKPENAPAVSGPYLLSAYNADAGTAELVPNPNWWGPEGPYLSKIEFRYVPEQQVLGALVQNGEIDASLAPAPPELRAALPDYFRPIKSFGFNVFWFNVTNAPTDELAVRQALTQAVNFDDVYLAAFPTGEGVQRATQLVDQDLPCLDETNAWYTFDVEAARAALAASSYGSAEQLPRLRVTPRGSYAPLQRALEAIIEAWRQNLGIVNVEFKAQPSEFGPDADKINLSRDDVVIRFPDTATYMWTAAAADGPVARANPDDPAGEMLGGYANAEIDELLNQALQLPPDDEQRCTLALQAQERFMNDYTVLPFGEEIMTLNAREYVRGYVKGPDTTLIEPWKLYLANR